jgi:serine/threonine protein phosphatase PrpC
MSALLQARVIAFTHQGAVRSHNEDTIAVGGWVHNAPMEAPRPMVHALDRPLLCLVADGMGGHAAGEEASRLAALRLAEFAPTVADAAGISAAVRRVNREIFHAMREDARRLGMGTTVAGILIRGDGILWFNVGDSRLFRYRDRMLRQLSIDDVLDPDADPRFRLPMITQALGGAPTFVEVEPHVGVEPLAPGARYLMCSDGLTDMVDLAAIEAELGGDDVTAVAELFDAAMFAGGHDNISMVLVRIEEDGDGFAREG